MLKSAACLHTAVSSESNCPFTESRLIHVSVKREGLLSSSQKAAIGHYPEPADFKSYPPTLSFRINFNIILSTIFKVVSSLEVF
jgi:hypothetical protein